jgi:FAD/FMN-containing dehydrogenase
MAHAVTLLGMAHQHLGAGLTGFEVMGQFALSLVAKHFPQLRVPFLEAPAAAPGSPKQGTAPSGENVGTPFCVLLENSDHESEVHAREQLERLLEAALEQGCVSDAVVAESLTQAHQLWHVRESITLAQAEEGLNIKHDISIAVSRIPEFVQVTDALLEQAIPGVRLVNFGHLGDGNLHYNVQAPADGDAKAFLREREEEVNTIVYDSVERFDGSISAEHGVGSLKLDKLEHHKSPVALGMMRAIKQALDPHKLMNPGRVLRL